MFNRLLVSMSAILLTVTLAGCGGVVLDSFTGSPSTSNAPPNSTRGLIVLNSPQPVYPMQARTLGVEGWVHASIHR